MVKWNLLKDTAIDYFFIADVPVATLGSTGTHRSPPSDPAGGNNRAETEEIGSRHRASKLVVNILIMTVFIFGYTVATEGSTGMKRRSLSSNLQRKFLEESEIKSKNSGVMQFF